MRQGLCVFATMGFLATTAFCSETAYQALKVAKASGTEAAQKSLVEISGEGGHPQPDQWKFLFNDPSARGGVREIVVENGAIVSERTPLRGFAGVGDMPTLASEGAGIDSDKAFRIAEKEAIRRNVGFRTLDYSLRPAGDTPVWTLRLYNNMGALIGKMEISGATGAIVQPLAFDPDYKPVARVDADGEDPSLRERWREDGGLVGKVRQIGDRTGNTIKRTTLRVGGSIQEFFTGERTIDENENSE